MPLNAVDAPKPVGRPKIYDDLELAALFCEGQNKGQTIDNIANNLADLIYLSAGIADTRSARAEKAKLAVRLKTSVRRSRARLLEPLRPETKKENRAALESGRIVSFGPVIFNGRGPLASPVSIEPRVKPKLGRRKS